MQNRFVLNIIGIQMGGDWILINTLLVKRVEDEVEVERLKSLSRKVYIDQSWSLPCSDIGQAKSNSTFKPVK